MPNQAHPPPRVQPVSPWPTSGAPISDGDENNNLGCQNPGVCGPGGSWDASACACIYQIQECGAGRVLDVFTNQCIAAPGTSCGDGTVSVGVPCPGPSTGPHPNPVRAPQNPCQQCNAETTDCRVDASQQRAGCQRGFADVVAVEFCREGVYPDWSQVRVEHPPCTYVTDRATGVTHQVCPDNVTLPSGCVDAWHHGMAGHTVSGTVTRGGNIQFDGSIDGGFYKIGAGVGGKIESTSGQTTTFDPAKGLDSVCGQRFIEASRSCDRDCSTVCR
jgi:hypothetical protein